MPMRKPPRALLWRRREQSELHDHAEVVADRRLLDGWAVLCEANEMDVLDRERLVRRRKSPAAARRRGFRSSSHRPPSCGRRRRWVGCRSDEESIALPESALPLSRMELDSAGRCSAFRRSRSIDGNSRAPVGHLHLIRSSVDGAGRHAHIACEGGSATVQAGGV
jgi:hypothetical protein